MLAELAKRYDHQNAVAIEFGVYKGDTLQHIRNNFIGDVYGLDSFQGLPETWRNEYPQGSFATTPPTIPNTTIITGLFAHTTKPLLDTLHKQIRLIHIDCDLYSSTRDALQHIAPHLAHETIIIFDEYDNYPGSEHHEHKAFHEWLNQHPHITATLIGRVEQDDAQQAAFHLQRGPAPDAPTG
jgi:hypothetical protein